MKSLYDSEVTVYPRSPMASDPERDDVTSRVIIARCVDCRSAYVARKWADGTIRPLDRREGCECGSTSFDDLTTAASVDDGGDAG